MANRLEDRIRDYLAEHLHLLGEGLTLVHKEHLLPNPLGAGGRIDILARDALGIFVVIEIKRSDQSARQALNEIHKYTGLLRIQHGLDETRVRIVIVSTDWSELRLPLSECADVFRYSIEPFAITTTPDGTVSSISRVPLLSKSGLLKISREQHGFCFSDSITRDLALPKLVAAASTAAIKDFAVLSLDYEGNDPSVCYPKVLYLLFSSPLLDVSPEQFAQIKAMIQWEDGLDQPDDNFISALLRSCDQVWEDSEVGYPEKLSNILDGWKIVEFSRHGRLARDHSLLTDDDIVRLALALEGGSPIYICKLCSPKYKAHWQELRKDIECTLRGMAAWETVVPALLTELEHDAPDATVSIDIYNPTDLLMSLYPIVSVGEFTHCPFMEVVIEDVKANSLKIVLSMLAWNGVMVNDAPERYVEQVYGGVEEWLAAIHFHQTHRHETDIMAAHGLSAPVVEFTYSKEHQPVCALLEFNGMELLRKPFDLDAVKGIQEFSQANASYLGKLKIFVDSYTIGLPGQTLEDRERRIEELISKWKP